MALNTIPVHGSKASFKKNSVDVEFRADFSLNVTVDTTAVPRQGQGWKEKLAGQADWNGSWSLYYVPGNTEQKALIDNIVAAAPGATLTDITFFPDAGGSFSGSLIVKSLGLSAPVGGEVKTSYSFEGTGALSFA